MAGLRPSVLKRTKHSQLRPVIRIGGLGTRCWLNHRSQGKRQEAHDLLVPVHGWFSEGLDTPDLMDAKALLDGLAGAVAG